MSSGKHFWTAECYKNRKVSHQSICEVNLNTISSVFLLREFYGKESLLSRILIQFSIFTTMNNKKVSLISVKTL